MTKEIDFDIWWKARYFYPEGNHKPLYSCLKKFHERGATLYQIQEIDTLGGYLIIGDMWATDIDNNNSSIRRKRSHHAMRSFAPLRPYEAFLKAEIEELKAEIENLKAAKENYRKLFIHAVEAGEKGFQEMAQRFQPSFLMPALMEFHVPDLIQHAFSRSGRKFDSWGSFFLLGVTEYMKQELRTPHYRVADDLLRAYRTLTSFPLKPGRPGRRGGKSRAIDRIRKLKQSHPHWNNALTPILLQLQLNRNGIREYRASGRRYLKQKLATEPITYMVNRYLEPLGLQLTTDLTTVSQVTLLQKRPLKKNGKLIGGRN
jgi:hypothetical protein